MGTYDVSVVCVQTIFKPPFFLATTTPAKLLWNARGIGPSRAGCVEITAILLRL